MGNRKHYKFLDQIRRFTRVIMLMSLFSISAQAQHRMPPIPDEEMTEAQ